jgi:hypothetical protein
MIITVQKAAGKTWHLVSDGQYSENCGAAMHEVEGLKHQQMSYHLISYPCIPLLRAGTTKTTHKKNVLFNTCSFPLHAMLSGRTSSVHKIPTYSKHS